MSRRPDFVIIGGMKCATTTLRAQLARQSGIYMPIKELNFFSDDEIYSRGTGWYEDIFKAARKDQICGETSTHYTKLPTYPHTIDRLAKDLPDARLIYAMRHPMDRLVSQYIHEWSECRINEPIEKAIERYPELTAYSLYAAQLDPYLDAYGPERILPVFFDRLLESPEEELKRICQFIGHPGKVTWRAEPPQNVSRNRIRKNVVRTTLIRYPLLDRLTRKVVPRAVRRRIKRIWTLNDAVQIGTTHREELRRLFNDDLARLGKWLGTGLSCENFREVTAVAPLDWGEGANYR